MKIRMLNFLIVISTPILCSTSLVACNNSEPYPGEKIDGLNNYSISYLSRSKSSSDQFLVWSLEYEKNIKEIIDHSSTITKNRVNLDMLAKAVIPADKHLVWTQQLTGQLVAIAIDDTKFSFAYDIEIVYEYRTEGTKSWGEIVNIATIKLSNL